MRAIYHRLVFKYFNQLKKIKIKFSNVQINLNYLPKVIKIIDFINQSINDTKYSCCV